MTSEELRAKYEAAVEKVEKRKNIIIKACKKAGVNADDVFNAYYAFVTNYKGDYLRSRDADAIADDVLGGHSFRYDDPETQIIESLPKLFDVEKTANNWKIKLDTQSNKESVEKIPVIWDFLTEWENKARDWYLKNAEHYADLMNEFHDIVYNFLQDVDYKNVPYAERKNIAKEFNDYMRSNYGVMPRYKFSTVDGNDFVGDEVDSLTKDLADVRFVYDFDDNSYDSTFGSQNVSEGHYELVFFDIDRLNKILAKEKENKYFDLCNRISAVVGEITDARGLYIGRKNGELNGVVEGTDGAAKVETIGAGGWNTHEIVNVRHGQCFHYRVLVHKIR